MGGGPDNIPADPLKSLLTPELFSLLVNARLPYQKQESINFSDFGRDIFLQDPFGPLVKGKVWPALIALSKIGLDRMPDLSACYLPAPTDPTFPEQCLGLQLLLDLCPRLLCRGVDQRWTFAYFDVLSQRVAEGWYFLPPSQRPDQWPQPDDAGQLDYWIGARFWFGVSFAHSEHLRHQEMALEFTEETRSIVERVSRQRDPYRKTRNEILQDLYGFPREYRRGPPLGDKVTRESWAFWAGMLMDIHKPIVDRFGRYPYLNAVFGRASTADEEKWIDETDHFGEAGKDVARKIKEDVRLGRWRPLGEGSLC
ncbi:hypothetical protein B0H66DRAFT_573693 [Apodospora peruviana]|uniref:Uncharacterized protein n=1 Tax=Apodospora peruviana TaxID=516989 RepID=A0AAE0IJG6_9PEZI|nr:hypothetical protein B0H66DRAFT_573693 [Apodospora peruviana]